MFKPLLALFLCALVRGDWQDFIIGPQSREVEPVRIVSVTGNITNPNALLSNDETETIITRSNGEPAPAIVIDFGMPTVGFLKINFNGSTPNLGIRLAFSETLQYLTDLSDYNRMGLSLGSDQIAVSADPYVWTDSLGCQNGSQVCSDGLHGFRYVKLYVDAIESDAPITTSYGTVRIQRVTLDYTAFLPTIDSFQGWFECSDLALTQYWYAGVYTNDMTTDTFRETDVDPRNASSPGLIGKLVLLDGAKRDRDPYVGDVAVSGLTTLVSHGSNASEAIMNVLADLADHQRDDGYIPSASVMNYTLQLFDYPLWWIVATWEYVIYSNNMPFLDTYFNNIVRVLDEYYPSHTNETSKLISKPTGYGDYAFVDRYGESSYYNALYVIALNRSAEIATALGKASLAEKWQVRAAEVSAAIHENFWDKSVFAYRDSKDPSTTSHPQDGNSLAILAGIPNNPNALLAINYLHRKNNRPYGNAFMDDDSKMEVGSERVYAFMSTFEIQAKFEHGLGASAVDQIHRTFGWMYEHDPTITFWEGIGPQGSMYQGGFTSAVHGWSTGVTGLLTNYLLGFRMVGLNCSFVMDPAFTRGGIDWAEGDIPTGFGVFQAHWQNINNNAVVIGTSVPPGCDGDVVIPGAVGPELKVLHNGKIAWSKGRSSEGYKTFINSKGRLVFSGITTGKHEFVITE